MRTTEQQLYAQADAIHRVATELGMMPEGSKTTLDLGSKLYGRAYRLGRDGGYRHPAYSGSGGCLGMTKAEASHTLSVILDTLYCVQSNGKEVAQ